jgi:hypothetical protein
MRLPTLNRGELRVKGDVRHDDDECLCLRRMAVLAGAFFPTFSAAFVGALGCWGCECREGLIRPHVRITYMERATCAESLGLQEGALSV